MKKDVEDYTRKCHICQTTKAVSQPPQGELQPLEIPERPWWSISLDFITGLTQTKQGNDAILTVVDRLTKMVHLIPTTTTCSSAQFAKLLRDHVISKHGVPKDIVSDRDPRFTGKFWEEVTKHLNIHRSMSTSFHPQTDGNTERVNRMVEQILRAHVGPRPTE